MKLSILVPAYNEDRTIAQLLAQLLALDIPTSQREIIVIDDGSRDATQEILTSFGGSITVMVHPHNRGKGAAVRSGIARATGEYIVVQDADLEYDPHDILRMLAVAERDQLRVLFGSRRLPLDGSGRRHGAWRYYLGGILVTWCTNLLHGTHLTDEPTCYKMVRRDLLNRIPLNAEGFEFCPELTAKIARLGEPIGEIPINYHPRTGAEGKKIRPRDGIIAVAVLLKYRFWRPERMPN